MAETSPEIQKEIRSLQRRYGSGVAIEKRSDDCVLQFLFHPTDPDFSIDLEAGLLLSLRFPNTYPSTPVEVTAVSPAIPSQVKKIISSSCDKFCALLTGKPMVRELLRWLDRHLEELLLIGLEQRSKKYTISGVDDASIAHAAQAITFVDVPSNSKILPEVAFIDVPSTGSNNKEQIASAAVSDVLGSTGGDVSLAMRVLVLKECGVEVRHPFRKIDGDAEPVDASVCAWNKTSALVEVKNNITVNDNPCSSLDEEALLMEVDNSESENDDDDRLFQVLMQRSSSSVAAVAATSDKLIAGIDEAFSETFASVVKDAREASQSTVAQLVVSRLPFACLQCTARFSSSSLCEQHRIMRHEVISAAMPNKLPNIASTSCDIVVNIDVSVTDIKPIDDWTAEQQAALTLALQEVSTALAARERWEEIAHRVGGKTRQQCVERFKQVRADLLQVAAADAEAAAIKLMPQPRIRIMPMRAFAKPVATSSYSQSVHPAHRHFDATLASECARLVPLLLDPQRASASAALQPLPPHSADVTATATVLRSRRGEVDIDVQSAVVSGNVSTVDVPLVAGNTVPSGGAPSRKPLISLTSHHRGTRIVLGESVWTNVATINAVNLHCLVACQRCQLHLEVQIAPHQPFLHHCNRCHLSYAVQFRPELMHSNCDGVMGYVDVENCYVFDLLPSAMSISCFACATEFVNASKCESVCHTCHQRVIFSYQTVDLQILPVDGYPLLPEISRVKKAESKLVLRPGYSLPMRGACRHYKHSYRWFRFACCDQALPCDRCHDELNLGHDLKLASRMICGNCSLEQPFSQKPCKCGQEFTSIAKVHWEGGAGCRNRTQMSNKDNKKFAGLKKTMSRKAQDKKFPQKKGPTGSK